MRWLSIASQQKMHMRRRMSHVHFKTDSDLVRNYGAGGAPGPPGDWPRTLRLPWAPAPAGPAFAPAPRFAPAPAGPAPAPAPALMFAPGALTFAPPRRAPPGPVGAAPAFTPTPGALTFAPTPAPVRAALIPTP